MEECWCWNSVGRNFKPILQTGNHKAELEVSWSPFQMSKNRLVPVIMLNQWLCDETELGKMCWQAAQKEHALEKALLSWLHISEFWFTSVAREWTYLGFSKRQTAELTEFICSALDLVYCSTVRICSSWTWVHSENRILFMWGTLHHLYHKERNFRWERAPFPPQEKESVSVRIWIAKRFLSQWLYL